MAESSSSAGLIQIRLVTKQTEYAVADTPLAVPSIVTPEELNKLLNNLIQETQIAEPKTVEFDFLIDQEIIVTPIKKHLELKNLSTEQVIEVEYVERVPAPKPQDCYLHDDWVGSVHAKKGLILSGAYDGTVKIWNNAGKPVVNLSVGVSVLNSANSIKAVSWATLKDETASFIAGGQDQTIYSYQWDRATNTTQCLAAYKGHERAIQSVDTNAEGTKFASVGWDGFLKIWALDESSHGTEPPTKRSKKALPDGVAAKTPEMTLKGHMDCVSCVRWFSNSELVTASFDHTLRLWDVEEAGMKHQMSGNKAFLSCDYSRVNRLIAATAADKLVRIYDPRSNEGTIVKQMLHSHTGWVTSTRWSKTNQHLLISGGHDNLLKLWDTRSPRAPLYDMTGHKDKILCCDWSDKSRIVSGGADNSVRVFDAPSKK